jgi:hypothetical protein
VTALVSRDHFSRHAVAGFAFRDASDNKPVADGLDIALSDAKRPERIARLMPTASGTWMTPRLPGLGAELAGLPEQWPARARLFTVDVVDRLDRYLPARFEARLPMRGRFVWPGWAGLDRARIGPLFPAGAPADFVPDYLPLFPAIARPAPGPCATVRAQLAFRQPDGKDRPAPWAAMTVSIGGVVVGLGVADAGGALAVSFPYPPLPVRTPAEAAEMRSEISWEAALGVYYGALEGAPPDLTAILGQLAGPAMRTLATLAQTAPDLPPTDLPPQDLVLGRPLTVATSRTATERFSSLYLETA